MDEITIAAYDRDAAAFAGDWETQPAPSDMQDLIRHFFEPGPTADVGCGSGRDTAWLNQNGFGAIGYDASEGLIAEARRLHPQVEFRQAWLPELSGIEDGSFANVLCETVIMHLAPAAIGASVRRLMGILRPRGVLYLSWRTTRGADQRDQHGRLYTAFDSGLALEALASAEILVDTEGASLSSGKWVRRLVARKGAADVEFAS